MTATMQPKLAITLTSSCHHQNDEQRLLCGAGRSRDMYCTMAIESEPVFLGVKDEILESHSRKLF